MKSVRRTGTEPELRLRRYLHAMGLRFATKRYGLPGTPDLVLPCRGTVIFVHGCFWHGHNCRHGLIKAKSNAAFWDSKINANRTRDRRKAQELKSLGWSVETVWECELNRPSKLRALARRLRRR